MNRQILLILIAFALGAGTGIVGMKNWLARSGHADEAEHHPAPISYARDTCCPADGDSGADAHAGHSGNEAEHEGHAEHGANEAGHSDCIKLSEEAIRRFGIETAKAEGGKIEQQLVLPGEIVLNTDRVAHIVPRVAGMVREVRKSAGDRVEPGEVLAVLESRELAEARAADLTAEARLKLAETDYRRVETLWNQKLVSEKQYLEAQQSVEQARIGHRETMAKLHALGLAHDELGEPSEQDQAVLARYEVKAPFAGTVVERHATLGEVHDSSSTLFVIADLATVWADITVYAQDTARIQVGDEVRLKVSVNGGAEQSTAGKVFYISPTLREATRTGLARAVIQNERQQWRPGMFVTAEMVVGVEEAQVVVPHEAVQKVEGESVVFVADEDGFEKRPVEVGKTGRDTVQIASGLNQGEPYVSKGAFILKAELSKGEGGHEH